MAPLALTERATAPPVVRVLRFSADALHFRIWLIFTTSAVLREVKSSSGVAFRFEQESFRPGSRLGVAGDPVRAGRSC